MQIRLIDVHDDAEVQAWWETAQAADAHGRDYAAYWSLRAATAAFRAENNPVRQHPLAAFEGDAILGVNQVILPRLDNTHVAYVEPLVHPDHRGRGIGSALLEASLDVAREADRRTAICEVNLPLAEDPVSPNLTFAHRRGFEIGILDIHRVLALPVNRERLDALAAETAPFHEGFHFVTWEDRVPDEHLAGFCALQAAFNREAPSGELELEDELWDEERVRNAEDRFRKQGRSETGTLVIAPDGTAVGLTEMMTIEANGGIAWQSGTLVLPSARGHRLGLAMKVANLRHFQGRHPLAKVVHSWNAEANGPMVAINERLGFRPVERLAEMQLQLS